MAAGAVTGAGVSTPVPSASEPPVLRRLHPLTPVFRSWRLGGIASAVGFGVFRDDFDKAVWIWHALHGDADLGVMARAFLVLLGLALVSATLAWLSWRSTGFAIVANDTDPGTLLFHRGLVNRQRSQVRLKRVQSVDVNEPFVPRLFGLAAVKLEMAAGEGASINLSYLGVDDAWALREEILRHTSVDAATAAVTSSPPTPDEVMAHVATRDLVKATLLEGAGVWLLVVSWLVAVVVLSLVAGSQALVAMLSGILPASIALLVQLGKQVSTLLQNANFVLMRTPTGIRTRAGLTSTTNRTIDVDRVQAVRVEQPFMWRHLRWARASLDVAGAAEEAAGASVMPVAHEDAVRRLAGDVAGEQFDPVEVAGPGARAWLLDPLGRRYLGVALLEGGAVSRTGRWRRTVSYVPYARIQSVSVRQGWLQRRLKLATVYLDLPSGAERWHAPHRDVQEAEVLVRGVTERARRLRRGTPVDHLPIAVRASQSPA